MFFLYKLYTFYTGLQCCAVCEENMTNPAEPDTPSKKRQRTSSSQGTIESDLNTQEALESVAVAHTVTVETEQLVFGQDSTTISNDILTQLITSNNNLVHAVTRLTEEIEHLKSKVSEIETTNVVRRETAATTVTTNQVGNRENTRPTRQNNEEWDLKKSVVKNWGGLFFQRRAAFT